MDNLLKISIISASPRHNSSSLRVAKRIKNSLESKNFQAPQICDFEGYDIPWVGQGELHPDQLTDFQAKLINTWATGELLIFVVPEYNWNTAPQLINAVDQLGGVPFDHLFDHKVFAFCGVSSGRGGRMPAVQMTTLFNKIISFTDKYSMVSPKIHESHETAKNIDEHGNTLGNAFYDKPLEHFLEYSIQIAKKFLK